jgi:hypothetical protein
MVSTVLVHFEMVQLVARMQRSWNLPARVELLAFIIPAFIAHLLGIGLYAIAFAWMHAHPELGALMGDIGSDAADFFYFSLTCYTTLGFGEVYAVGPMRITAGIEGLNGLVLIAWSATFTFVSIEKVWRKDRKS